MTDFQRDYLTLIKNALDGTEKEVSEDFDWTETFKVSKMHQTESVVYYGAIKSKSFQTSEIKNKFIHQIYINISISEKQIYAYKETYDQFEKSKISFLPIKGIVLKKLYPYAEMRTMGDIDILIKSEEYDKIKVILKKLGYSEGKEGDYALHWDKGNLHIELHKKLIPSYYKDFYSYYRNCWEFAKRTGENTFEYRLTDEDFFVYIFTHFTKHYRGGGAGIKYILDFYVFFKTHPELDKEYIKSQLKKLYLDVFYKNIIDMMKVWFCGENSNEKSDFLTDKIFTRGVYGTKEDNDRSEWLRISKSHKNVKAYKIFNALFPPYSAMKIMYPIVGKLPVLLPFFWIFRFFQKTFSKDLKKKLKNLKNYEAEAIMKYKEELNYVGLDYNFKE